MNKKYAHHLNQGKLSTSPKKVGVVYSLTGIHQSLRYAVSGCPLSFTEEIPDLAQVRVAGFSNLRIDI